MNISTIYRHPAELEAEAMLCREHPYPESFTFTERTTERMNRARAGLVHVMTEIAPTLDAEQSSVVNCWLSKILVLVESTSIDAEKKA
ncbi:nicotinic acetylcholine receptor subunit beta [Salmonella enterica]|nr:nicotinic acetylcholine receptor subunit beta [Salmonella enterica]